MVFTSLGARSGYGREVLFVAGGSISHEYERGYDSRALAGNAQHLVAIVVDGKFNVNVRFRCGEL